MTNHTIVQFKCHSRELWIHVSAVEEDNQVDCFLQGSLQQIICTPSEFIPFHNTVTSTLLMSFFITRLWSVPYFYIWELSFYYSSGNCLQFNPKLKCHLQKWWFTETNHPSVIHTARSSELILLSPFLEPPSNTLLPTFTSITVYILNTKRILFWQKRCKTLFFLNTWMSLSQHRDLTSWFNSGSQPTFLGTYHHLLC